MNQSRINLSNISYKDWIGLSAAPVFWLASLVCFTLGLAFKTGTGFFIPGTAVDVTLLFSVGLGFANTAIQIVGNDTEKEDLGVALLLMWGASYMLGIGSNVNFLYSIIGLSNGLLQFLVCWGLGIMIEVAPERLLVRWLRAAGILRTGAVVHTSRQNTNHSTQHRQMPREQRHEQLRRDNRQHGNAPPILHPIQESKLPTFDDLPEFLRREGATTRGSVSR